MSQRPVSITLVESQPTSADNARLQSFSEDLSVLYSDVTYPLDPSGTTVIPIGSNGFLDPVPPDAQFVMRVQELKSEATGPIQDVPGGPFPNTLAPNGFEDISVQ